MIQVWIYCKSLNDTSNMNFNADCEWKLPADRVCPSSGHLIGHYQTAVDHYPLIIRYSLVCRNSHSRRPSDRENAAYTFWVWLMLNCRVCGNHCKHIYTLSLNYDANFPILNAYWKTNRKYGFGFGNTTVIPYRSCQYQSVWNVHVCVDFDCSLPRFQGKGVPCEVIPGS